MSITSWFARFDRFGSVHAVRSQDTITDSTGADSSNSCGIASILMINFKMKKHLMLAGMSAGASIASSGVPLGGYIGSSLARGAFNQAVKEEPAIYKIYSSVTGSVYDGSTYSNATFYPEVLRQIGLSGWECVILSPGQVFDAVKASTDAGNPVIARVGWNSGGGHFTVIDQVHPSGHVCVCDPWDGELRPIKGSSGNVINYDPTGFVWSFSLGGNRHSYAGAGTGSFSGCIVRKKPGALDFRPRVSASWLWPIEGKRGDMASGHAPTEGEGTVKPASRLGQVSWALFDWANQPFFTLVTTFIFGPYFAGELVAGLQEAQLRQALGRTPDPAELAQIKEASGAAGQAALAFTQSASGVLLALLSPFLGSMADITGRRKPYILIFQILTAIGCGILWFATPGSAAIVPAISFALILATIGAEFSIVFNNAQLPSIVEPSRMGWLSGLGWGLGYTGGLLSLFIVLAVRDPAMVGLAPAGSPPLFGLDAKTFEVERLIGPASALWLALFVIPMFLFTPDGKASGVSPLDAAREGARKLWATIKKVAHYRNPFLFLIAYMVYNDGLAAIIAFGGVYAKGVFGWSTVTLGIFGIIITLAAIPGCLLGGRLDDRIGSRRLVLITTAGVTIAALGILSVSANKILFFVSVAPLDPARGLFGSAQELTFMAFALLLGACMGPMQAGSRTMMGRLAPQGMSGEFYGLFALSGRATAWMAPTAIAIVTTATETQRWGVAVVIPFLVIGFVLLWFVREERASAAH